MPPPLLPMTPPEFSILLLAWDDADPGVAVLGGMALPPTRDMVYQLAAQQPVLAVYPHLPAEPADGSPQPPSRQPDESDSPTPPATKVAATDEPGVLRLPLPTGAGTPNDAPLQSRIVGLNDLIPARSAQLQTILEPTTDAAPRRAVASGRSQWPPAPAQGQPRQQQAPAAPYAGASPMVVMARPIAPRPVPTERPPAAPSRLVVLLHKLHPLAGDLNFDPDPELPALLQPLIFDEPTEEIGAAEAYDLSAPEDDLVLEEPTPPAAAPAAMEPIAPSEPIVLFPALEGLNFRMIQYARRAAQLVRDRSDFRVIYAPNWPAWLAALEIRNSSRQPLVLYVASLAANFAAPTERGWLLEVERMTLRRATLILVPDEDLYRRLRAQYGATIGEIRVVAAADEPHVQQVLAEVAAG